MANQGATQPMANQGASWQSESFLIDNLTYDLVIVL